MSTNVKMLPSPVVERPSYEEIRHRVDSLLETETLLGIAFDLLETPPRAVLQVLDDISPTALQELLGALRSRVGLGWT